MFICEECLEKYTNWSVPISYGRCEDCGKTKPCVDIKCSNLELKVPTDSEITKAIKER